MTIIVSEQDLTRIRSYLGDSTYASNLPNYLRKLNRELETAEVLSPDQVPSNVVAIDSRVEFTDLDSDETFHYTLVLPSQANIDKQRMSITVPMGAALLGYKEGDTVEWPVPGGTARIHIDRVVQEPQTN